MTSEPKADLLGYLRVAREALVWKLDGASEYDIRRPLTPTGTNLLGLVKHVSGCEIAYFGDSFGRPFPGRPAWLDLAATDPTIDMWAAPDESREDITGLYRAVWAHSDETIEGLPLDAPARVPHWSAEKAATTLHRLLVHMIAETHRHAGHADIVRELVDGRVGMRAEANNMAEGDEAWWAGYRAKLEQAAKDAGQAGT
ncbi:hypothetical protein JOD54_000020 [Actinokineospora baliensis]|uniref:DinB family protein n=1 Tax=Actinokineospora baliensis TaxID=547056 RepID=UPI00195BA550|nr:DinB family protein [Actinokineospora baliensis]MBM7769816.1 hypothetical protein [Actinokineospora baliensis]